MTLLDTVPVIGNAKKGIIEVAGIGIGSVTHHTAIQHVIPAVDAPAKPSGDRSIPYKISPTIGPRNKTHVRNDGIIHSKRKVMSHHDSTKKCFSVRFTVIYFYQYTQNSLPTYKIDCVHKRREMHPKNDVHAREQTRCYKENSSSSKAINAKIIGCT